MYKTVFFVSYINLKNESDEKIYIPKYNICVAQLRSTLSFFFVESKTN